MKKFKHTKYMIMIALFIMLTIVIVKVIYFSSLNSSILNIFILVTNEISVITIIAYDIYIKSLELGYEQLGYKQDKKGFISYKYKIKWTDFIYIAYLVITIVDFTLTTRVNANTVVWWNPLLYFLVFEYKIFYGQEDIFIPQIMSVVNYKDIISLRKNKEGTYTLLTEEKYHKLRLNENQYKYFINELREKDLSEEL